MSVSNKRHKLKLNVIGWWPAKGMTPQVLIVCKMVIIREMYIEHNNHCSPYQL